MLFSIPFDCSYYDTIILVDGAFADAKLLCGGPDGGPVLYDVKSQAFGPLLHVFFQTPSLPASDCSILCGGRGGYACREHRLRLDSRRGNVRNIFAGGTECATIKL